jgi:hypothetical protein
MISSRVFLFDACTVHVGPPLAGGIIGGPVDHGTMRYTHADYHSNVSYSVLDSSETFSECYRDALHFHIIGTTV